MAKTKTIQGSVTHLKKVWASVYPDAGEIIVDGAQFGATMLFVDDGCGVYRVTLAGAWKMVEQELSNIAEKERVAANERYRQLYAEA